VLHAQLLVVDAAVLEERDPGCVVADRQRAARDLLIDVDDPQRVLVDAQVLGGTSSSRRPA